MNQTASVKGKCAVKNLHIKDKMCQDWKQTSKQFLTLLRSDAFLSRGLNLLTQSYKEQFFFYRLRLQSKMIYYLAYIADESWAVNFAGLFCFGGLS